MADDKLDRIVEISPAYDKRPKYGQHCVEMRFYKGAKGVVQFVLFTGWYKHLIPEPDKPWQELCSPLKLDSHDNPIPADLGYHSPVPTYEGQPSMECKLLPGEKCYYDGSSLNSYRIFSTMLHQGGEAMWGELEDYYHQVFDEKAVANG